MKIFLLRLGRHRHAFYSEEPETPGDEAQEDAPVAPKGGLRDWMVARVRVWGSRVLNAKGGFGRLVQRTWRWLQRFIGPDEPLLRGLRKVKAITLYHPDTMSHEEARLTWLEYLQGRRRHHAIWLTINLLFSPLLVILAPLPGPNFVGYWFVYRAACHALALLGIRRVHTRQVETILIPNGLLNVRIEGADTQEVAKLATDFGLHGLDIFLIRVGAVRDGKTDNPTASDIEETPVSARDSSGNATTQL